MASLHATTVRPLTVPRSVVRHTCRRRPVHVPLCLGQDTAEATRQRDELKSNLTQLLSSANRGIFGLKTALRTDVLSLLSDLEEMNPTPCPTEHLSLVDGEWSLLFSTITITGSRRTKLGLREFVSLGEFRQIIDVENATAENVIEFQVMGLGSLKGQLMVHASFAVTSAQRVSIELLHADLKPEALQKLFQENFEMLLQIFNPAGWLDITYLDESHRIGRDDKNNVFYLERRSKE